MVMGLEKYSDEKGLSVVALGASLDRNMSRYFSAARYHRTDEEFERELSGSICSE
jgi:hypothetical protein